MAAASESGSAAGEAPPRQRSPANAGGSDKVPPPAGSAATAAVERARKRSKYTDNWQRRKADELAPQVVMQTPLPQHGARVAIIGGGVSGLVCARELARLGLESVVFDTGERGPGGRLATRTTADGSFVAGAAAAAAAAAATAPPLLAFDHAAQLFTADDAEFQALAREWLDKGWVREWAADKVVCVGGGGGTTAAAAAAEAAAPPAPPFYVPSGPSGFRGLARALADDARATGMVELRFGAWVSRLTADARTGKWRAASRKAGGGGGGGKDCSDPSGSRAAAGGDDAFDAVVLAHNGKCLNRLAAPMGCPLVAAQVMRLRLSASWVALLAFERTVGAPFEGAFVDAAQDRGGGGGGGGGGLAWAGNNSAKLGLGGPSECWTLVSTDAFAQRRKVPQERVPADVAAAVARELMEAFAKAAGAAAAGGGKGRSGPGAARQASPLPLPPLAAPPRVQLWGAALPLNSPGVPALLDPASRVGVCGDWLLGAGVQSAAASGLALARRVAALRGVPADRCAAALEDAEGAEGSLALGLRAPFAPLAPRTGACGEFPPAAGGGAAPPAAAAPVARAAPALLEKAARR